jgi:hypothetical protein
MLSPLPCSDRIHSVLYGKKLLQDPAGQDTSEDRARAAHPLRSRRRPPARSPPLSTSPRRTWTGSTLATALSFAAAFHLSGRLLGKERISLDLKSAEAKTAVLHNV